MSELAVNDTLSNALIDGNYNLVKKLLNHQMYIDQLNELVTIKSHVDNDEFEVPRFTLANTPGIFKLVLGKVGETNMNFVLGHIHYLQLVGDDVLAEVPTYIADFVPVQLNIPGDNMYEKWMNTFVNLQGGKFDADYSYDPDSLLLMEKEVEVEEDNDDDDDNSDS